MIDRAGWEGFGIPTLNQNGVRLKIHVPVGLRLIDPPASRLLTKSASGVLASFRSSTGTRPPHHSAARTNVVLLIRRTVRPRGYASGLHSLRPCCTAFLNSLRAIQLLSVRTDLASLLESSSSLSTNCLIKARRAMDRRVFQKRSGIMWAMICPFDRRESRR